MPKINREVVLPLDTKQVHVWSQGKY